MTLEEYIEKNFSKNQLNEYSFFSGWHETILEIVQETWVAAQQSVNQTAKESGEPLGRYLMEKITREEIEMCQIAVGIVIDIHDLTPENKAKWDALLDRLEVFQKETCLAPLAPDLAKRARPNDCEIDPETLTGRYADDPPSV